MHKFPHTDVAYGEHGAYTSVRPEARINLFIRRMRKLCSTTILGGLFRQSQFYWTGTLCNDTFEACKRFNIFDFFLRSLSQTFLVKLYILLIGFRGPLAQSKFHGSL